MATITLTPTADYRSSDSQVAQPSIIGAYVRECREARGMSLGKLADALGVTRSYLSKIEAGWRDPDPALWLRIGQAVGCDLVILKRKYRLEAARRATVAWEQVNP